MAKIDLDTVPSGHLATTNLNDNFQSIEDELNEKVLYRNNPTGESNEMLNDLDMNSNRILNLPTPVNDNEPARYVDVRNGVETTDAILPSLSGNEDKFLSSNGTAWVFKAGILRYATVASMVSDTSTVLGQVVACEDYATGNDAGVLIFKVVAAATGTADGGSYIDHNTLSLQFERIFHQAISVKDYGATGDGSTDERADLSSADTTSDNLVFPSGTYLVNSNLTLTSSMIFYGGAKLKPASGITITISGSIVAGEYQHIFDVSAGGSIVFDGDGPSDCFATWFGVLPDNSTVNTTTLQAGIDCVNDSYQGGTFGGEAGNLRLPSGIYRHSGVIIKKGVNLVGDGQANTILLLDTDGATGLKTPAKASQLAADAVSQSVIKGITMGIHSSLTPTSSTILFDTTGLTKCTFEDLGFVCPSNVIGVDNTGNTLAGSGGPAHWYNTWIKPFVDCSGGVGIRWGDNDSSIGEQVTAQTMLGGRIGGTSGTGIHIRGGTGNSFHGVTFEGLNSGANNTIIMGDTSGTRTSTSNNFHGCYLEQVKVTYYSNTNRNRRWGCYETTVSETDNGTRNGRVDDEQLYGGWSRNYVSGRITGGASPSVNKDYNITSVSRSAGTGIYDITFDVTMPDINYVAIAMAESSNAIPRISTKSTTTCRVVFENRAGSFVDPTTFTFVVQDNDS